MSTYWGEYERLGCCQLGLGKSWQGPEGYHVSHHGGGRIIHEQGSHGDQGVECDPYCRWGNINKKELDLFREFN